MRILLIAFLVSLLDSRAEERVFGLERREPWTVSRFQGTPEPPEPYRAQRVWESLAFQNPIEMAAAPGLARLFVAEQRGTILSVDPNAPASADEFANLRAKHPEFQDLYGMVFHPKFAENRQVFLCYVLRGEKPDSSRVSRFRVTSDDPPKLDLASEEVIITWLGGGHNGGSLQFGHDGCLYISTGDGKGPNPPDELRTGQDCTDLLSSILRIDVDRQDAGLAYRVPENPFVGQKDVRPEIWAFGFRNPWRMSFDSQTGELWLGDVGWDLWELVYRVERGANYGWSITEGSRQPINVTCPRGPAAISPPIYEHPHSEARSITGGYVYRGQKFPDLRGAYVYGDYDTGKIWALFANQGKLEKVTELMDTTIRIVCFGQDNAGELYIVDHNGPIYQLAKNTATTAGEFPRSLRESGLFADVARQTPAAGVLPYSINAEMWADGATSERWLATPGDGKINAHEKPWRFPEGTVLAKTLSVELAKGDARSRRRMETQVLHFRESQWNAYTYAWNAEQTDATLVAKEGRDEILTIQDSEAPGGSRRQRWRFASRSECVSCHYFHNGVVLGVNTPQINRTHDYGELADNQLRALHHIGLIDRDESAGPRMANPRDERQDVNARARAYLEVNCSMCHMPNGGGMVPMHLASQLSLAETKTILAAPQRGDFGLTNAKVITPGWPERSTLYYRMAKTGSGRMPHLGSSVVDRHGLELVHQWIRGMPGEAGERKPLSNTPEEIDAILASPSETLRLARALDRRELSPELVESAVGKAAAITAPAVREVMRRFIAGGDAMEEAIDPVKILAMTGDADRGDKLLRGEKGAMCLTCHQLGERGRSLGPSFDKIGARANRAKLLESLLEPAKVIDPAYVLHAVETNDGRSLAGLILRRDADGLVLKDAAAQETRLAASEVKSVQALNASLMPTGLLQGFTAQEIADLLSFLGSLR